MSGRNVSGVVPPALFEAAQQVVDYEGTTMSALVSSALSLYLGLSGAARRSARYVLATGTPGACDLLLDGCGRAIARAADVHLTDQLAARGRASGVQDSGMSDETIEADAVAAVRATRTSRRAQTPSHEAPRQARPRR